MSRSGDVVEATVVEPPNVATKELKFLGNGGLVLPVQNFQDTAVEPRGQETLPPDDEDEDTEFDDELLDKYMAPDDREDEATLGTQPDKYPGTANQLAVSNKYGLALAATPQGKKTSEFDV